MRNVVIMAFTANGYGLAERIGRILSGGEYSVSIHRVTELREFVPSVFQKGNILVFVGAAGIAVRAVAGLVGDKASDPAVVVIDELGRFVIPLLSGHIGGANRFAAKLSEQLGATPVITTATDINKAFSVDEYAARNRYAIVNPEHIKSISAALLNGKTVGLNTPFEMSGELPEGLSLKSDGDLGVYIGGEEGATPFVKTLRLMPKRFHIGIGARKNVTFDVLEDFFLEALLDRAIPPFCIGSFSSIDLKKEEQAILRLAKAYDIEFITYSAEQLEKYEALFERSDFVKNVAGVGNICETSAYLSSKCGEIIMKKTAKSGVTIAIAEEAWTVVFNNAGEGSF